MSKYTRYRLKEVIHEIMHRLASQRGDGGSLSDDLWCMANGPDLPVRYVRQLKALLEHPDCILINDLFDLLPKMRKAEAIEKEKRLLREADLQRRRQESQAEECRRHRDTQNRLKSMSNDELDKLWRDPSDLDEFEKEIVLKIRRDRSGIQPAKKHQVKICEGCGLTLSACTCRAVE